MTPFQAAAHGICGQRACRLARLGKQQKLGVFRRASERARRREEQARERQERRLAQATQARGKQAETLGIPGPESFAVIVLPLNERRLVPLPRRRRYRFAARLTRLLEDLERDAPDAVPASTVRRQPCEPAASALGMACATCRGRCCVRGGTLAYLNVPLLQRYMAARGQASRRDVLEAYCRHLPDKSYEGSCVFHSGTGCTLPPEMRADTCHSFVCTGFSELQDRAARLGERRFFLAAVGADDNVRSRFVGATG